MTDTVAELVQSVFVDENLSQRLDRLGAIADFVERQLNDLAAALRTAMSTLSLTMIGKSAPTAPAASC